VAAYFPDLLTALTAWMRNLKAGGWIVLTEIDDLFGHEPLSARTKASLSAFAEDALAAGRYDFHMGRKLEYYLERSGFTVSKMLTLQDQELSFSGPAAPDVQDAWRDRFKRMGLLRDFCGPDFDRLQEEFLDCLMQPDHRSVAGLLRHRRKIGPSYETASETGTWRSRIGSLRGYVVVYRFPMPLHEQGAV
jgi:hypothetical protein